MKIIVCVKQVPAKDSTLRINDTHTWIRDADIDGAARECTEERLRATGNVSHAYMNFLLALGVAGTKPTHAEGMKRRGSDQPWFAWELAA